MSKTNYLNAAIAIALCGLLSACAVPKPGANLNHAESAIRAARVAGADTYAPDEIAAADSNFRKAQTLIGSNRANRARKLLELATAQADLAAAISEAEHAESALATLEID
jgi:hypothetical protein